MSLHDALRHAGRARLLVGHDRGFGTRDFGGVRYLFCRGLDAGNAASPGVRAWTFALELVAALDALFAGHGDAEAAT